MLFIQGVGALARMDCGHNEQYYLMLKLKENSHLCDTYRSYLETFTSVFEKDVQKIQHTIGSFGRDELLKTINKLPVTIMEEEYLVV